MLHSRTCETCRALAMVLAHEGHDVSWPDVDAETTRTAAWGVVCGECRAYHEANALCDVADLVDAEGGDA